MKILTVNDLIQKLNDIQRIHGNLKFIDTDYYYGYHGEGQVITRIGKLNNEKILEMWVDAK